MIGFYKTAMPNTGLGGDAWQLFEVDENDVDGGKILGYFRSDATYQQLLNAAAALAPGHAIDWITEKPE